MKTGPQNEINAFEQFKLMLGSSVKTLYKPIFSILLFMAVSPGLLLAQTPTFSSSPIISVGESDNYNYLIVTNDANNTISATTKPAWLTLSTDLASITFAGTLNAQNSLDGQGKAAEFNFPSRMAMDAAGNNYILEHLTQVIRKVSPTGAVTTIGQFPGTNWITVGSDNNIYATSGFNVNRITPAGGISIFAGSSSSGYVDATGGSASFENPQAITTDASGNLYVMDNYRLRKVTTGGVVTTLAGAGTSGYINANGATAKFEYANNGFFALAVDASGNIYVGEDGRIRKVTPTGDVSLFSGSGEKSVADYTDGTKLVATYGYIDALIMDADGNLLVTNLDRIRMVTADGTASTLIGSTTGYVDAEGAAAQFSFGGYAGITVDSDGSIFIVEFSNGLLRKLGKTLSGNPAGQAGTHNVILNANDGNGGSTDQSFTITVNDAPIIANAIPDETINDNAPFSLDASTTFSDPNAGTMLVYGATLSGGGSLPSWLSFDPQTVIFSGTPTSADLGTSNIVLTATDNFATAVTESFNITVIATNFAPSFTSVPVTTAAEGVTYNYEVKATDSNNDVITISATTKPSWLSITTETNVSTLAGSSAGSANGAGSGAQFSSPNHIAVDAAGNTYVADAGNHQIRKITPAGDVSLLAGTTQGDAGGLGVVQFNFPAGIAVDATGNVYIGDKNNHKIKKIAPGGVTTTFAGSGVAGAADGQGTAAQFSSPEGLAFDASGNLFVADGANNKIRKIDPSGLVSTFAGSGVVGVADGTGIAAEFYNPTDVAVDNQGNIYVADWSLHRIRKMTSTAVVTTFAGPQSTLTPGYIDSQGTSARFRSPYALDVDAMGNVYVADRDNHKIRKISPGGAVSTFAGTTADLSAGNGGYVDGSLSTSLFSRPSGIAIDSEGTLYVADRDNHKIRKITTTTTLSGDPVGQPGTDNVVLNASDGKGGSTDQSFTITVNNAPTVANAIPDQAINQDAALSFTFDVNTFNDVNAGTNLIYTVELTNGDPFPTWLSFDGPTRIFSGTPTNSDVGIHGMTVIAIDNFSATVSDQFNLTVVNLNDAPTFNVAPITSVRVNGAYTYAIGTSDLDGDVFDVSAPTLPGWLNLAPKNTVSTISGAPGPTGIDIDGSGNVIMIDRFNQTVVKITPEGTISILAGQSGGGTTNGTVTEALFNYPIDLTIDVSDNIYIVESNHRIRKITPAGDVTTFAGSTTPGSSDGSGASASFNDPQGLATDAAGNVYVSDGGNNSIRKITPQGVVTTFAGSTASGFTNGTGSAAQFSTPKGLEVDVNGNVYVADYGNNVIRKITPAGEVTTYAGSGQGFADGASTVAMFNGPSGVDLDINGNVYVADRDNFRIRKISPHRVVSTIAGSSSQGSSNGIGTAATFTHPEKLVVATDGTLYVSDANSGVTRKITPATITGNPAGQLGSHSVVLNANDGNGGDVNQTFTIEVLDISKIVNPIPDQVATQDASFSFAFDANAFSGPNPGDPLTYTATLSNDSALPSWLSFDGPTRAFSGTPTSVDVEIVAVKVSATDATQSTASDIFNITVNNVNDAPVFNSVAPTVIAENQAYSYEIGASDIDGDPVTLAATTLPGWLTLNLDVIGSTVAGSSVAGLNDATGAAAQFDGPTGVAVDANGNIFVADKNNNVIRKITSAGVVTQYVGDTDDQEITYSLSSPAAVTVAADGNLYIANTGAMEVLKVTPEGVISNVESSGGGGGGEGGPPGGDGGFPGPPVFSFNSPTGLTVDASGNIYVADAGNHLIKKVTSAGVVSTFAGSSQGTVDGNDINAAFNTPTAITIDASGNLYVTDAGSHRIRMITSAGVVSTLAGSSIGTADGAGTAAQFNNPTGIALDGNGDLLVTDQGNHRIRKVTMAGVVTTVSGSSAGYTEGSSALFDGPAGIALDTYGNIFVADNANHAIRKLVNLQSLTGTSPAAIGFHDVVLNATDGNGGSTDQSFTVCVGNLIWTGATDTDWATATNWSGGVVPLTTDDVIICDVTNDPIITSDVEVSTVDIKAGGMLAITSNSLKVTNGTVLTGTMNVSSGASFVPMGSVTGAGAATINRNTTFGVNDGQYSVIGSPITLGSTSDLGGIIYSYDETIAYDPAGVAGSTRFVAVNTPETIVVGDAYFSANTGSIAFSGIPNSGNVDVSLVYDDTRDEGAINAGFNLVSNPYTAAISYADFVADNADIDGTIYLWDDGGSVSTSAVRTNSDYIIVSNMGASGGTATAGNSRAAQWDGFIRSTQGFFVKATTTGNLSFKPQMMDLGNNSDGGYFRQAEPTIMRFSLSSEAGYNDILVGFVEGATLGLDRTLDAQKLKGNNVVQFYSRVDGTILGNQALPFSNAQTIIDLGFDVSEPGTYKLQIDDLAAYGSDILLIDKLLNQSVSIAELGSYSFETKAVANSNRFSLVFNPNEVLDVNDESYSTKMIVFTDDYTVSVRIDHDLEDATVSIYNLVGSLMKQVSHVDLSNGNWSTGFHYNGVFIMAVESGNEVLIKKFLK